MIGAAFRVGLIRDREIPESRETGRPRVLRFFCILLVPFLWGGSRLRADTLVSGTIAANTTWTVAGSPYVVTGDVLVEGAAVPVLTIQAGVTVKFNSGRYLRIGQGGPGGLQAIGTSTQRITFTANSGTPAAGFWNGVWFYGGTAASSRISYGTLNYGSSAIRLEACSPLLDNLIIQTNSSNGILVWGASSPTISASTISASVNGLTAGGGATPTISASTLTGNSMAGVAANTAATISLQNVTITNNTIAAIRLAAKASFGTVSGLTVSGNGQNAVQITGDGTVDASLTWKNIGLPYHINTNVVVSGAANPVLTIEAGNAVRFDGSRDLTVGTGGLQAVGTATQPILFTANTSTPTPGFWSRIRFSTNTAIASRIAYATIEYAGNSSSQYGSLHIEGASPSIENTTIRQSPWVGLWAGGLSAPSLQTVTFANHAAFPVSVDPNVTFGTMTGLTFTANGTAAFQLRAATVTRSATWRNPGLPYVATGSVSVANSVAPVPVLTISAGLTVKFPSGAGLKIGETAPGGIQAVGTSAQRIILTSSAATPSPGSWLGVQLFINTVATSQLQYVTVDYAGVAATYYGGIHVMGSSPTIGNTIVQNNIYAGITITGGAPTLTSCTVSNNPNGIRIDAGSAPSLQTVSITNNTGSSLLIHPNVTLGTVTGLSLVGNGVNEPQLNTGSVDVSTTWKNIGYPYKVISTVNVEKITAPMPVLTIQAGVTLKFGSGTGLQISPSYPGGLQAIGTSTQPITFTADSASPTPGFWSQIHMGQNLAAGSRISYATISYANTGINIARCAPTIDNTTIRHSSASGIWVRLAPAAANLQNVTITNSSTFPMKQEANVTLGTVSGLAFSSNGTNAVQLTTGTVDLATRWKNLGYPYVTTAGQGIQVMAATPVVLTIDPGVIVKFPNLSLYLGSSATASGGLNAVGTASQPITFTSSLATPTPGSWAGLVFNQTLSATANLKYATVSYAGTAISVQAGSPVLDHVTLTNSSSYAVDRQGGTPTIRNCNISANQNGMRNSSTGDISAELNWWNSASGPSGTGPGTGQSVTARVLFEPWLTAPPSTPQFFTTATATNPTFNPAQGIHATSAFTTPQSGSWTATIKNSAQVQLRQFSGTGTSGSATWDGKDTGGVDQPNGTYTYTLQSTAGANVATPAVGRMVLDRTRTLALSNVALDNLFFSPNADAIKETARLTADTNYTVSWTVAVKNSGGATVRTLSGSGTSISATWDGKNGSGVVQADGVYSLNASATAGTATVTAVRSTTLDATAPTASITQPAAAALLSNVHANGVATVNVSGTANDTNLQDWRLEFGVGSSPTTWMQINYSTAGVTGGALGVFDTLPRANGAHVLRVSVVDRAGTARSASTAVTVGNFKLSASSTHFNTGAGATINVTSTVPFSLTETLVLKDQAGQVVRTLFNGTRAAGSSNDVWNGRNQSNALLPDGPYFYSATVTAGASTMAWNETNQFLGTPYSWFYPTQVAFDPFNNNPLPITYNFTERGRVTIAFDAGVGVFTSDCLPPRFCILQAKYEEPGSHTVHWAGVDSTGAFRGDARRIAVVSERHQFSRNAIIQFGTAPSVTNVRVTPPVYGPAVGSQTISFNLSTYQNQAAAVVVEILNQGSKSILRTITRPSQAPGVVSIVWDGRANNGMWVARGPYTVTVRATDALGNKATGQICTTVQF